MERIRAFVALNLPVAVIDKVAQLQAEIRKEAEQAGMRVAWVPPPNMHATLQFLGDIPLESSYAIRDRLTERLAGRCSFEVAVEGVGVFPDASRPRVLWLGLRDSSGALDTLARDVMGWLDDLGFEPETRPFHAHLTLGRIKEGSHDIWTRWVDHHVARCEPTEVTLYRSILQRKGAEYSALARVALGKEKSSDSKRRSERPA